jgi:carbon storage regulator CsrA
MLILSRKRRESVVVGGADGFHRLLRVIVLEIKGAHVKLGFEVDSDVPVHRAEVWERINAGGQAVHLAGGPVDRVAMPTRPPREAANASDLECSP